MISVRELNNDPRIQAALNDLKERGLPEDAVPPLLRHIASLPDIWADLSKERPNARHQRRRELAHHVRSVAIMIENDPEASLYRILDHESVTDSPIQGRIKVSEFIKEFADMISTHQGVREMYPVSDDDIERMFSTKPDLRSFVRRDIARVLQDWLPNAEKRPITAAATLASAVLKEEITYQEMKEAFRRPRP